MTQLLQNIYFITPYLFVAVLLATAFCAIWLISELKKSHNGSQNNYSVSDRLFLKRNASRLRKMEFH
ncbi:hypothetical protein [Dyadobacter sediminis]|uniref:Uncharacterized protein n=1 Tax=Dyadobacter sediminis TaxID=1493691 RepID=A0A5R9KF33_9BACT|nr:hypothetical protein [Dyadobacter sediminis]TLU94687.1 hypothetical protein FEM55_10705 [Dyadobacter sediminis]